MSYEIKYLKYKNKYLNLKKISQKGGSNYDKTIILSCKEFDEVVDKLIALDGVSEPILLDGTDIIIESEKLVDEDNNIIVQKNFDKIKILDRLIDRIDITDERFHKFIEDITSIKIEDLVKDYKKKIKKEILIDKVLLEEIILEKFPYLNDFKYKYMRKMNNYETKNFFRGFINWKKYPDATPDIKMNKQTVSKLRGAKIIYFAYFSFNELDVTTITDQLLFLNSLSHYGVGEINIVLPYFPVGTMERIVGEGEIPTGYSLAHMLNSIPNGSSKNKIYIYDIHALCSRFFFHTNTIPILITMMSKYIKYIETNYNKEEDLNIIVFPDDGAKKRYEKFVPSNIKKILCNKTRIGDSRITRIEEGVDNLIDKDGKIVNKIINLFLIDDLVQSGGTILEAFKGINKQLCYLDGYNKDKINFIPIITHSIFPNPDNIDKFFGRILLNFIDTEDEVKILSKGCNIFNLNKFITTNSRPNKIKEIQTKYNDKIQVIDISESFYDVYINNDTPLIGPYSLV
jgi:phosphoribosylpyrophosphate synthetase